MPSYLIDESAIIDGRRMITTATNDWKKFWYNEYYKDHLKIELFFDDVITGQDDVIESQSIFGTQDRWINSRSLVFGN